MNDIMGEGITIVEDLHKKRQLLPKLEAIYILTPTPNSVEKLIADFSGDSRYKAAHLFFTETCPRELFEMLAKSKLAPYVKTFKEMNMAFIPYETQVFCLESVDTFKLFFNPRDRGILIRNLETIAGQIATVCATLGEYPSIR